ncbi:MAG: PilX N-terminal domain-containing pilus assembly protein [Vicinamibacterales bacterium]
MMRRARADERGMALVAALLLLLVMSGLALALTTSGRIDVAMSGNEELYIGARAAAEAGLNHAASVILPLTTNPTYALSDLLVGPDGAADAANPAAAANADNGDIAALMGGTSPWHVTPNSPYTYTVRVFDDDDPRMKGGALHRRRALGHGAAAGTGGGRQPVCRRQPPSRDSRHRVRPAWYPK